MTPTYRTVTLSEALTYVWYAGMAGVGAWFLFTNLRFARALRKARTPYRVEGCRYPVYLVSALPSPCLFGVLRPAVYLNEKALQSPDALRFVLAHEQTHARHLDPLWSLLRGLCLTVYWFDPLVWLAAVLSREDGELACDEGTLRALGADERAAYGKTLLALVPVCDKPQNPLLGATTMTSGKRSLKERITCIAENRQAKAAAVFAVVALAALLCAVSFTGAPDTPPEVTQEWYDAGFTTEDAQACLEFLDWAAGFDGDNATGASWMADGEASLNALEPQAEFARVVRSIRMEELSPFTDSDEKTLYTLGFNDGRASYGFGMHEGGRITLIAPREVESGNKMYPYKASVAVVDNAALSALFDYLRGEASPEQISHPAFPNNLTEAERGVVDEFPALGASSARRGHSQPAISERQRLALPRRCGADRALGAACARPQRPHRSGALHAARLRRQHVLHAHGESAGRHTIHLPLWLRLRAAPLSRLRAGALLQLSQRPPDALDRQSRADGVPRQSGSLARAFAGL